MVAEPNTVTRSSKSWSVSGKVFLLGEYAVLAGAPALVAAVPPRFSLSTRPSSGAIETVFHPESPAGRLLRELRVQVPHFFSDPARGAGGFGASTAQFILAAAAHGISDWKVLWEKYRALHLAQDGVPPSGADLVGQVVGGVVEFLPSEIPGEAPELVQRQASLSSISIAVIQASSQPGRKTATHSHLAKVSPDMLDRLREKLEKTLDQGLRAFTEGDAAAFASTLGLYAETLSQFDLEIPAARLDREALSKFPGVMGCKGTGALQSDALIAVVDSEQLDLRAFREFLEARGLALWCPRLESEDGLRESS